MEEVTQQSLQWDQRAHIIGLVKLRKYLEGGMTEYQIESMLDCLLDPMNFTLRKKCKKFGNLWCHLIQMKFISESSVLPLLKALESRAEILNMVYCILESSEKTHIPRKRKAVNREIEPPAEQKAKVDDENDKFTCKICLDAIISATFVDCGHACACRDCAATVDSCPVCRKPILTPVAKLFLS